MMAHTTIREELFRNGDTSENLLYYQDMAKPDPGMRSLAELEAELVRNRMLWRRSVAVAVVLSATTMTLFVFFGVSWPTLIAGSLLCICALCTWELTLCRPCARDYSWHTDRVYKVAHRFGTTREKLVVLRRAQLLAFAERSLASAICDLFDRVHCRTIAECSCNRLFTDGITTLEIWLAEFKRLGLISDDVSLMYYMRIAEQQVQSRPAVVIVEGTIV